MIYLAITIVSGLCVLGAVLYDLAYKPLKPAMAIAATCMFVLVTGPAYTLYTQQQSANSTEEQ